MCICVIYHWIFWMLYYFALCILGLWYKHLGIHTFKIFRINVAYHYIILLWLDYIQESGINERLFTSCMINKNFFLSPINRVNFSLKTVSFSVNFTLSVFSVSVYLHIFLSFSSLSLISLRPPPLSSFSASLPRFLSLPLHFQLAIFKWHGIIPFAHIWKFLRGTYDPRLFHQL